MGFKKGNQLALGKGRPVMSDGKRALLVATRTKLKELMVEFLTYTQEEVEIALQDKGRPVLDHTILKAIQKGCQQGDMVTVDWITDHIMGKQSAKAEIKMTGTADDMDLSKLSDKELKAFKALALKAGTK